MKKHLAQTAKTMFTELKEDFNEYGGSVSYDSVRKCYTNSRNPTNIMEKYHSYYENSSRDYNQIAKDTVQLTGRFLSGSKKILQIAIEDREKLKLGETFTEFKQNIRKLDVGVWKSQGNLGMLENNSLRQGRILPSELQTVMAGVTRRFAHSEAVEMYQSIFHFGELGPEEDFNLVRAQNDVVVALSYRHEGDSRMSQTTFLEVLANIFHVIRIMKPEVTYIRLWVDALASRRAKGRSWVSKGILPYTVFPVCVCDRRFSLRWNRTWINIETILGLMGAGLMVFDQKMAREMELENNFSETWQEGEFYFCGAREESVANLKLLASLALRGVFDKCEITWESDYDEILRLLSRAAICDSVGTLLCLLSPDVSVEKPIKFQAEALIETFLGFRVTSRVNVPFLEARALNTRIEYVWGYNTPYPLDWQYHKLLLALKHLGCMKRSVIECAESILQKDQPIWLVLAFENYQVAVEFHREWAARNHVRLVHVLINGNDKPFEGQIVTTLISCWSGKKDVNYQYMTVHKIEYIANAINVMKIIAELKRIGAVEAQSELQKFWLAKNEDVLWTMGPPSKRGEWNPAY